MATGATVNAKLVREVIATVLSDAEIEGLISSASVFYREYLGSSSLGPEVQLEIQRYLAAHFVSLKDPTTRVEDEKIGDSSVKYSHIDGGGNGLKSTRWGRMALEFDPTKQLGSIGPAWYAL